MDDSQHLFCNDFDELVGLGIAFYEAHGKGLDARVLERRARLSSYVEGFHKASGTFTSSVMKRVEDLREGNCIVLMAGHQPNLFPYSGVLRKATLCFALAKILEERTKVPVVSFFGIADQDFTDDRWVKSCQLPAITRSDGILELGMKCPKKKLLNAVEKPSPQVLEKWKADVEKWLDDGVRSINESCREYPQGTRPSQYAAALHENAESFWALVEECYRRSRTYSDFNAFIMSRIVNDAWGYDTIFARYSECQQAFAGEFGYLLSHSEDYSRSLREVMKDPRIVLTGYGVSDSEPELAPFWYHCDCGSKARLYLFKERGVLTARGNCVGCEKHFELDLGTSDEPRLSDIASKISARSIAMNLVFFRGMVPSFYAGGAGAIGYLTEARHVAKAIDIPFPPVAIWRPSDRYLGLGQLEAVLQLKRICVSFGASGYSEAKELLVSKIHEVRSRLDELEASRIRVIKEAKEHPNVEALKEQQKAISMSETSIKRDSNLSLLNRNLELLQSVPRVLNLMPSILDYAINIGLKETSLRWIWHLNNVGDLSADVSLGSILSRDERVCGCLEANLAYCSAELKSRIQLPVRGASG
jgi:hypothetical protein